MRRALLARRHTRAARTGAEIAMPRGLQTPYKEEKMRRRRRRCL